MSVRVQVCGNAASEDFENIWFRPNPIVRVVIQSSRCKKGHVLVRLPCRRKVISHIASASMQSNAVEHAQVGHLEFCDQLTSPLVRPRLTKFVHSQFKVGQDQES